MQAAFSKRVTVIRSRAGPTRWETFQAQCDH
jgi:hypothetical protein